ncbi:hypothetical protein D3C76_26010 [compost metagenome]
MRIKQGTYPESAGIAVKVDGQYREVTEGYTKVNGVWVPWEMPSDNGDVDLGTAMSVKTLDGLILNLLGQPT